eukprot:360194-Chlamydomonas_euryale.AAC.15
MPTTGKRRFADSWGVRDAAAAATDGRCSPTAAAAAALSLGLPLPLPQPAPLCPQPWQPVRGAPPGDVASSVRDRSKATHGAVAPPR